MDGVDKQGEEGEVMTVIYVDTLFLLNVLVDYLLLLCAARLAGEPLKRLRFALGAVLGEAMRWPSSCQGWGSWSGRPAGWRRRC